MSAVGLGVWGVFGGKKEKKPSEHDALVLDRPSEACMLIVWIPCSLPEIGVLAREYVNWGIPQRVPRSRRYHSACGMYPANVPNCHYLISRCPWPKPVRRRYIDGLGEGTSVFRRSESARIGTIRQESGGGGDHLTALLD